MEFARSLTDITLDETHVTFIILPTNQTNHCVVYLNRLLLTLIMGAACLYTRDRSRNQQGYRLYNTRRDGSGKSCAVNLLFMLRDLAGFVTLSEINDVMLAECTAPGHIILCLLNWAARVPVVVII